MGAVAMTLAKAQPNPLPTIWEIPDELWRRIEPILREYWPRKPTGRKVANWRKMLNAIIFRLRSGCQWEKLPERYGPKSTVHDWFQRWVQGGIFEKIWAVLVAECDELGGVQWQWQSADAMLGKARFGGKKTGKNPTDRGKKGTKKSLLTDGEGGPLGVVIAGANVVEQKLLSETIEAIVIERPDPDEVEQNLNLDKGYDNPRSREAAAAGGYVPHIRRIGEEKKPCDQSKGHKPRRWVVERTFAWLSKCRGILVRYEKKDGNYLGLIQMACGLLWYRRLHRMGRCDATQNTT
jgi:putative transposase